MTLLLARRTRPRPADLGQIDAAGCQSGPEARAFRLAAFAERFPGVLETLTPEAVRMIGGGASIARWITHTVTTPNPGGNPPCCTSRKSARASTSSATVTPSETV